MRFSIKNSRFQIFNMALTAVLPFVAPVWVVAEQPVLLEKASQPVLQEKASQPVLQEKASQPVLQEKASQPVLREKPAKHKKSEKVGSTPAEKRPTQQRPIRPTSEPQGGDSVQDIIRRAKGGKNSSVSPQSVDSVSPRSLDSTAPVVNSGTADSEMAKTLSRMGLPTTPEFVSGSDPNSVKKAISRLEATYELPPEILNLRGQLPADPESIIRQLNLHPPVANTTDLSDRTPTVEEIIEALRLR
jgi:hypothetical protein